MPTNMKARKKGLLQLPNNFVGELDLAHRHQSVNLLLQINTLPVMLLEKDFMCCKASGKNHLQNFVIDKFN